MPLSLGDFTLPCALASRMPTAATWKYTHKVHEHLTFYGTPFVYPEGLADLVTAVGRAKGKV